MVADRSSEGLVHAANTALDTFLGEHIIVIFRKF